MTTTRRVSFTSQGRTLAADLYLPDAPGPHPIVVMAGGWCYVKELIQPHYGKYFNDAGYATLIFDYACFGDSEGEPRQHIEQRTGLAPIRIVMDAANTPERIDHRHEARRWDGGRG